MWLAWLLQGGGLRLDKIIMVPHLLPSEGQGLGLEKSVSGPHCVLCSLHRLSSVEENGEKTPEEEEDSMPEGESPLTPHSPP